MKSLLISGTYFPPQVGGISRIMERLAQEMGPDRVCCLTGTGPDPDPLPDRRGARVYRSPLVFSNSSRLKRAPAWAKVFGSIITQERPQATLLGTVDDGIPGRWLHRWFRLPYLVFAHGNEIVPAATQEGSRPAFLRTILGEASAVVAISRFTADLVERAGVSPDRIEVIPPGCDGDFLSPRSADPAFRAKILGGLSASHLIMTTGNLVQRKGHDVVIQALPRLLSRLPGVAYVIVGDGPHRAELQRLAAELGVADRVIFAGRARDADLPALYALCDVFVMPSRARLDQSDVEGFGLVFLEANACGKPVVGGRSGGVPEAILDGETGLLVDPEDPAEVASALERILVDRELAARMGAQGRERIQKEYRWPLFAQRVEQVLEKVISR